MKYEVILRPDFEEDIKTQLKAGNKKLVAKIGVFLDELYEHPRTGTGKPEQLKGYEQETWSRRIDSRHRLVYEIHEYQLIVVAISALGHYGDR